MRMTGEDAGFVLFLMTERLGMRRGCRAPRNPLKAELQTLAVVCALLCFVLPEALGCPYSVRDVGFVDLDPAQYRLYCFVRDNTPQKDDVASTFEKISRVVLMDANVEAELVNIDQQEGHEAVEYFRFWEIKSLPAAVVVSPTGRSMPVPISSGDKPFEETAWSALESVVSSPKRDELMDHIVRAWCVILLVQGADPAANSRAEQAVTNAKESIAGSLTPMGRTVDEAAHIIVIPAESLNEEDVFLWSLDLATYDTSRPRVAVVYGRGRQIGPVLEGDNITMDSLLVILHAIGASCGCDTDRRWLLGTTIPMRWGSEQEAEAAKRLAFDPESPMVKTEVSRIWSAGAPAGAGADWAMGYQEYSESALGYTEEFVETEASPTVAAATVFAAQAGSVGSGETPLAGPASTVEELTGRTVFLVVGVLVVLVLAGSVLIAARAR